MRKPLVIVIAIVIIILLGLGIWWSLTAQPAESSKPVSSSNNETSTPSANGITIVFTDNSFEQQTYTVTAGQTVTVKNQSSIEVAFSSDDHPTHREDPELNMDTLQPGKQQVFTPTKTGTWGIHDHEHPEFTTTLTVTE